MSYGPASLDGHKHLALTNLHRYIYVYVYYYTYSYIYIYFFFVKIAGECLFKIRHRPAMTVKGTLPKGRPQMLESSKVHSRGRSRDTNKNTLSSWSDIWNRISRTRRALIRSWSAEKILCEGKILTSPDESRGQGNDESENAGHDLAGRRDSGDLRGGDVSRRHVRGHKVVLGGQSVGVLVQQVENESVRPAEAQLHLVLAAASVASRHRGVVLEKQIIKIEIDIIE